MFQVREGFLDNGPCRVEEALEHVLKVRERCLDNDSSRVGFRTCLKDGLGGGGGVSKT